MNLRLEILKEHSKSQCDAIVNYIGTDELLFTELIKLLLQNEYKVAQRASWVFTQCVEKHPFLIVPHLESVIRNMGHQVHEAVIRNTLRSLQFIEIPESVFDITAELCFRLLADRKSAIAVRVFSMTALLQIVKKVPELKMELQIIIEDQMPYASAGFVSRGRKTLAALKKIK